MKRILPLLLITAFALAPSAVVAQTNWLPGRNLVKLVPDYLRPRVYALNRLSETNNGTLLALNATNGATLNEIALGIFPTDIVITPAADALYAINKGSRTIIKVDLNTFSIVAQRSIDISSTYATTTPLYLAVGRSNLLYYTDGAWGPNVYTYDFALGTNIATYNDGYGAGSIVSSRDGNTLFKPTQYGWSAGYAYAWVTRLDTRDPNALVRYNASEQGPNQSREPWDSLVLLNGPETRVFNKDACVSATNVSVVLSTFSEAIYAISFDGSLAFGPTKLFNSLNGAVLTNFSISSTVQTLSGDQKKLFRYRTATSDLFVYDMSAIAPTSGPDITPIPASGSVVGQPLTNLNWSVSPIALAYDVYFGTNQAQVTAANTASAQYLGRVTSPGKILPQPANAGSTNYWRVDVVGFNVTNTGPTWSFAVSSLIVLPSQISVGGIASFNPASQSLTLTSSVPMAWNASVAGGNWLTISPTNGTSTSTMTVSFNTAAFAPGVYTNRIDVRSGGLTVQVPVVVDIKSLNITKMATDYQRPYIYALQAPALSGQNGQLLFINTTTGNIEKTLPIGTNPIDMTIHYGEDRLYIASWGEDATYVVNLATQTLLPPLHLGTDIYKINAGKPGRLITEGYNQWIIVYQVDTAGGTNIAPLLGIARQGDGETSPGGDTYYHCDDNISNANIHKYKVTNDVATEVAGSLSHPYGSRNLVLSPDATTLFWRGYVYDANLNEKGYLGEEIYATTSHGDVALGGAHAFNARNGQSLFTWPFSATVMAVSGDQQKVFLFNSTTKQLTNIAMSAIASVPGPGLNPTPTNGAVVNAPLTQVGWTASPSALSYKLYFGTNAASVGAATTNSAEYLGDTFANTFQLPGSLVPGVTYYWRVDSVGFSTVTAGPVWAFTVNSISVTPQSLAIKGVVGLPILPQPITLSSPAPMPWSLNLASPWITPSTNSGTTPATVNLNFAVTNFAAGLYTNELSVTANGVTLRLPVTLELINLSASKMVADPNRDMVYVLHPGSGTFEDAFLLFVNTLTGVVEKVIPIGANPTDLAVHRFEDRVYVSNWLRNQTRVVDLATRTELASLTLGNDVYKINGGLPGRLLYESKDQWTYTYLVNTTNGATVSTLFIREGDGEIDPSGRYYYHVDNNSSGAGISKYDVGNDSFVGLASAGKHNGYGSRNLVMSMDGSRLFWTGAMYDSGLYDFGTTIGEIYGCSTNGSLAFTDTQAYDTTTMQAIYNLPFTNSVMVVDRQDQRLWYFNDKTRRIESLPLADVRRPSITQQPAAVNSVPAGGTIYVTVTAKGIGPLSYQWISGGTNVTGYTNFFLSLSGIQPAQQGDYQAIVSNPYGSITSAVSRLNVLVPPTITASPQPTNVPAGQAFTLSVSASGSSPFTYRWLFENSLIGSATNSTLMVTNAQVVNEGIYRAVVMNVAGSVTSAPALVRVLPAAPVILTGPASLTVPATSNATFSVTAQGSLPMTYLWTLNDVTLAGKTNSTLLITNVQAGDAGSYRVTVFNGQGSAQSAPATLTVTPTIPFFVSQPGSLTLPAGTNFTLSGLVRGSEPLTYQWRRDGLNLSNAIQTSLTVSNASTNDIGAYTLIAFNLYGSATSSVASVVITSAPPLFVEQPADVSLNAGGSTTLNSRASGSSPIFYQWYFRGSPALNQTNRQWTLSAVTTNATGQYFAVASNPYGTVTSAVAQVTVNPPPVLIQELTNLVVDAGSSPVLTVNAAGPGPLGYIWQWNFTPIANSNATLVLTNIQLAQSGFYRVTVTNLFGSVTSTARVSVLGTPSLVLAWGDNSGGQATVPTNLEQIVEVAGGDFHSLALRRDGSLVAWGYNGDGQTNSPVSALRYVDIAAGGGHNLAIAENGNVVAWGRNDFGQRNVPAAAVSVVSVAAGEAHSLALLSSGTVVGWGDNSFNQVGGATGLTGIRAITAGRNHSLALRTNGTVVGWGFGTYGQITPPAGLSNVTAIAGGYLHSAALLADGTVVAWGDNSYGQLDVPAGLTNVVGLAAGDFHTYARRGDGSIVAWGNNWYGQTNLPPTAANSTSLASGYYHGLALIAYSPLVQSKMVGGKLVMSWEGPGTLQWGPTAAGPFFDMPVTDRCYTNIDLTMPAKFFRLRR